MPEQCQEESWLQLQSRLQRQTLRAAHQATGCETVPRPTIPCTKILPVYTDTPGEFYGDWSRIVGIGRAGGLDLGTRLLAGVLRLHAAGGGLRSEDRLLDVVLLQDG